jgi:hypothetical protein
VSEKQTLGIGKGTPGPGRKKGVPNKVTQDLKTMILTSLSEVGGVAYLAEQARERPGAYLALVGKVLPLTVAGDPGNPLHIVWPISPPRVDR